MAAWSDVVGPPVQVSETISAADSEITHESGEGAHYTPSRIAPISCICFVGHYILFSRVLLTVIGIKQNWSYETSNFLACAILGVPDISIISIGLWRLRRERMVPRGCECCSCTCAALPWVLLMGALMSVLLSVAFLAGATEKANLSFEQWVVYGSEILKLLAITAFSLLWIFRLSEQGMSSPGALNNTAEERFDAEARKDSLKFERAYVIVEFSCVVALVVCSVLGGKPIYALFIPLCNLVRIYRCFVGSDTPNSKMNLIATVLDVFNFSLNAYLLGAYGMLAGPTFVMNCMLSYMVLFVFSLPRSFTVLPICYSIYCLAALYCSDWNATPDAASNMLYLGIGLCFNLAAKRMITLSKWQAFLAMDEKTAAALHEKVLRFEAEFARERAITRLPSSAALQLSATRGDTSGSIAVAQDHKNSVSKNRQQVPADSVKSVTAESAASAPTILCNSRTSLAIGGCAQGDCLPSDALVWVRDEPRPKQLKDLSVGEWVLCFDQLGRTLKHAEAIDIRNLSGPKEWVTVFLEDGTSLEMTCDHPVHPVRDEAVDGVYHLIEDTAKRASDLQAGVDQLMVLKVVPIRVENLDFKTDNRSRVAISVQQPERHSIFVSALRQTGQPVQMMALDSSSLGVGNCREVVSRHTFVDVLDHQTSDMLSTKRRPQSAPPSIGGRRKQSEMHTHVDASDASASSDGTNSSGLRVLIRTDLMIGTAGNEEGDKIQNLRRDVCTADQTEPIRLSELLRTREAGLASAGSVFHQNGQCKPCAFENRRCHIGGSPCFKDAFCERCHEWHPNEKERKRVERRRHFHRQNSTRPPSELSQDESRYIVV